MRTVYPQHDTVTVSGDPDCGESRRCRKMRGTPWTYVLHITRAVRQGALCEFPSSPRPDFLLPLPSRVNQTRRVLPPHATRIRERRPLPEGVSTSSGTVAARNSPRGSRPSTSRSSCCCAIRSSSRRRCHRRSTSTICRLAVSSVCRRSAGRRVLPSTPHATPAGRTGSALTMRRSVPFREASVTSSARGPAAAPRHIVEDDVLKKVTNVCPVWTLTP